MRVSHDYHDSLIKPAPRSMGDMNKQTHKVLRKCMNEATVYWAHVPRQETQINTVIARKRWRMEEERGVKRAYSLSTLSVFDHWSLTLRGPDDFLLWIAQARGTFSYGRIKNKFCGRLCIFSNYNKYNLFKIQSGQFRFPVSEYIRLVISYSDIRQQMLIVNNTH